MIAIIRCNLLILLGALLVSGLFTHQGAGLNVWLLTLTLLVVMFRREPEIIRSPQVRLIGLGLFLLSTIWLLLDSIIVKFGYLVFFISFIGVVQAPFIRFIWYQWLLSLSSLGLGPWLSLGGKLPRNRHKPIRYWGMILLLPLFLFFIFSTMYLQGNTIMGKAFAQITDRVEWFIDNLNPGPYFMTFMIGGLIWAAFLTQNPWVESAQNRDAQWSDRLFRKRIKRARQISTLGLKREYLAALISLASLNGLILLANMTDIYGVWLGKIPQTPAALSQFVHQGTGSLILSVVLASGIVLFFFRKNLNFYPQAQWLTYLALAWIGQNAFLTLSVGMRNYWYANTYGLTYLRIGLFFFLGLVLAGLITLAGKVIYRYTWYGMIRRNARIWLAAFLILCIGPWDILITQYNLQTVRREHLDVYHLLTLASDRNVSILRKHEENLIAEGHYPFPELDEALRQKEVHLRNNLERKGPLGWVYIDWYILHPRRPSFR